MNCRLVMITWLDSRQPNGSWQWLSEFEKMEPVRATSVGWLIQDDHDVKVIAQSLAHDGDDKQTSGRRMTDLVARIRNRLNDAPLPSEFLLDEAADRIEALEASLREVVAVLDRDGIRNLYASHIERGGVPWTGPTIDMKKLRSMLTARSGGISKMNRQTEMYDESELLQVVRSPLEEHGVDEGLIKMILDLVARWERDRDLAAPIEYDPSRHEGQR